MHNKDEVYLDYYALADSTIFKSPYNKIRIVGIQTHILLTIQNMIVRRGLPVNASQLICRMTLPSTGQNKSATLV